MQLSPYLFFNGQCEEAFKFYSRVLGGKIDGMLTHAGTPAEQRVPAEWRDKILHARMIVGDAALMASDAPPGRYEQPKGFSVSIQVKEPAEITPPALLPTESIQPYQHRSQPLVS